MKTQYLYEKALKDMMSSQPLDSINAQTLSKKLHLSEKTFYYHYHDIYDLLAQVFLDERIVDIDQVKNSQQLIDIIYKYYSKNKTFVLATISSAGKDLFFEFLYNNCYSVFVRQIGQLDVEEKIKPNDRKAIARFFAGAYTYSIIYYFSIFKNCTLDGLKEMLSFLNGDQIQIAVKRAQEKKKEEMI